MESGGRTRPSRVYHRRRQSGRVSAFAAYGIRFAFVGGNKREINKGRLRRSAEETKEGKHESCGSGGGRSGLGAWQHGPGGPVSVVTATNGVQEGGGQRLRPSRRENPAQAFRLLLRPLDSVSFPHVTLFVQEPE
ncbi:UNVERIFIED_CONTAM: hypothetical protein PYX00_000281 [Menopon gallinae]|uniref:Uncharacterized protein n=1 Tax=Menopon gallinae TaxID=328185 RepID=A0AAW2I8H3_9NEOP